MQSNTVDRDLPTGKPRAARVDLGCTSRSTAVNADVPIRSVTLAMFEEAMIRAGLKQDAMAAIADADKGQFSRGLHEKDRKTFDPRWLDRQPREFWIALHKIIGFKFNLTSASAAELLLQDATEVLRGIEKLLARTVVSE